MGLSVGVLQMNMPDADRAEAYKADITYGTSSEFGFDFLRDRLKIKSSKTSGMPFWLPWTSGATFTHPPEQKVQRNHYYALVDEADNIFIDEARTPLIISTGTRPAAPEEQIVYKWADQVAQSMARNEHFYLDEKKHKIELSDAGKQVIRYSNPPMGPNSHAMDKLHEHIERALHAHHRFRRDQHYLVEDDKVIIIDEATGRRMPDRHWREGLHQAVEAKESVQINYASDHAAQITYQSYFKKYEKLAGMSGTAAQNFWELLRVYWLWVVKVPTNKPCIREHLPERVFPTEDAKFDAAVAEIARMHQAGRPVLIGTRTVDKSEILSQRLTAAGIPHQVLNAKPGSFDREADIVAQAGRSASVTVATNMAGRGTDILLGGNAETLAWAKFRDRYKQRHHVPPDEWQRSVDEMEKETNIKEDHRRVVEAGGLHVIGLERHEAARIDRQLIGRAARQGDPGSSQFLVSLEDDILEGLGPDKQAVLQEVGRRGGNRGWDGYLRLFFKAQRRVEKRHYRQRVDLMVYERNRQEILKDLGADPYVD
jgi:preprotein translocase subunit SecA